MTRIIAESGTNKIIYTRLGKVMWQRDRYDNGMLTHSSRMNTNHVKAEATSLTGWDVRFV